ncbi:MAG TPA: hypothetical protein VIN39_01030 [Candidatus Dormibacteraeota bacterium]|jgi:hypothetical protein
MPVQEVIGFYRVALVEAFILMLFFLLAFGAITVIGRPRWLSLGVTESVLARLAAAAVLGSMAVGGTSGVVFNLLQPTVFSDVTTSGDTARNQAVLGIVLALAATVVGVIRIEMHHRRIVNPQVGEDEGDWKVEPPEVAGRR